MHIDARGGTSSGARSVGTVYRLANSHVALLAAASLVAAFALGAPRPGACGLRDDHPDHGRSRPVHRQRWRA